MTVLKALGIDEYVTKKNVFLFIATLILLGLATNSLFELYKMLPSIFKVDHSVLDWENLLLYFVPIFVFILWVIHYYKTYKEITSEASITSTSSTVKPHIGLVLTLSTPKDITPEVICEQIKETKIERPEDLYKIPSIGQLFKSLYHHREELKYVWPLTTGKSKDFLICIDSFLSKFVPNAKNNWPEQEGFCDLKEENEFELIEEIKENLSRIFAKDNLQQYNCRKSDIIVDITGGTKLISIGNVFGAIDSSIDIQYVEQSTYNIIPLNITPRILLDKMGHYMVELHLEYQKERHAHNVNAQ